MTPQIPGYLVAFESTVRPLVAVIALGLIWMGAVRMQAPAWSRYTTAGVLSVTLIARVVVAQYLGSGNAYFATTEAARPPVFVGRPLSLADPAAGRGTGECVPRFFSRHG